MKTLQCETFHNQSDFAKILHIKIDIERILLEIEHVLTFDVDVNYGISAWLQMPKELISKDILGWHPPLSSFVKNKNTAWTKKCKWTYRECKERNFINPACECSDAFDTFCYDMPYTNEIIKKLNLYKSFVSIIPPNSSIQSHQDPVPKLQIPLQTNEDIYFSIDVNSENHSKKTGQKNSIHLPNDGSIFYVNTRKWHSVNNMSNENRIHICGDISPCMIELLN